MPLLRPPRAPEVSDSDRRMKTEVNTIASVVRTSSGDVNQSSPVAIENGDFGGETKRGTNEGA